MSATDMPGIRGSVLLSRVKYVRDRGGEAGFRKVVDLLPPADRGVISGWLLNSSWYPLDLCLRLDDAIAAVFSPEDRRRVFLDMGRTSAEVNLAGPHRHFVHVHDPQAMLVKTGVIYAAYYAVGRRTWESTGTNSGVLRTFDAESVTETDCLTVVGWHVRAIELCGGEDVQVVETACRAKGADHCEYHCRWTMK